MGKTEMMPMKLLKCEGCGLYHFCLGNITLNLTEKELGAMGNIIAQAIIGVRGNGRDVFENIASRRHGNLMN
ncbi:MAG: hypothetical protein IMF11_07040 [Proteobacteria bacterium]|nr:hypothetical protein [Pseudomonadota bacterium]